MQALILDFGCVLGLPQDETVYSRFAEELGVPADLIHTRYWAERDAYDRGKVTATEYWAHVAGANVMDAQVSKLNRLDAASWGRANLATVAAAEAAQKAGWRLALLSNMPSEVWTELHQLCTWLPKFDVYTISGHLDCAKPDARIYAQTLAALGTQADLTTFWDDRQENIDAAARLGIRARLFVPGGPIPPLT